MSSTPSGSRVSSTAAPRLASIQVTESDHLLLILGTASGQSPSGGGTGGGRSLRAFVYDRNAECWLSASDPSSFPLSVHASSVPSLSRKRRDADGILSRADGFVRSGSAGPAISARELCRGAEGGAPTAADVTRSHCEDRVAACAALGSKDEFVVWTGRLAGCLAGGGDEDGLRFLVDDLIGGRVDGGGRTNSFVDAAVETLGLDPKAIVRDAILPEISRNRQLQRLLNEVQMELGAL